MTAQHFAEVEVDDAYGSVRFVCTGGPNDVCRQWCAEGCEEFCTAYPKRTPADSLNFAPGTVIVTGHRWENTGSCREMDWLDAVGWRESGWVDDEPNEGGDREMDVADLRPGRHAIETEWTGDDYIWRYPSVPAEAAS